METSMHTDIRAGQRFTATIYGAQVSGTVTRARAGLSTIWVRLDGTTRERWLHRGSVSLTA